MSNGDMSNGDAGLALDPLGRAEGAETAGGHAFHGKVAVLKGAAVKRREGGEDAFSLMGAAARGDCLGGGRRPNRWR